MAFATKLPFTLALSVMSNAQVIACFKIYSGEHISYHGNFQVLEETNLYAHKLTNNSVFEFLHFYEGTKCYIKLTYSKGESVLAALDLKIPINRSKIKWKKAKLGETYDVEYRCVMEFPAHSKELRRIKRQSMIARAGIETNVTTVNLVKIDRDEDA